MMQDATHYVGHRMLEAMHQAVRYSEAIFQKLQDAMPPAAGSVLDFGAGDGLFVDKFLAQGRKMDVVEPDLKLREHLPGRSGEPIGDVRDTADQRHESGLTVKVI